MSVEIKFTGGDSAEVIGNLASFFRHIDGNAAPSPVPAQDAEGSDPQTATKEPVDTAEIEQTFEDAEEPEFRPYGEADFGKARRNKAQMEEDSEIEELAKTLGIAKIPTDVAAHELLADLRSRATEKAAEVSEEPAEEPVDEPETAPEMTREDVRSALAAFAEKHGMAEAQKQGPALLGAKKISDIEDDPKVFAEVVARIKEAT